MDTWLRVQRRTVGVITISLFVLLFSSSFVYGQWDSIDTSTIAGSSNWNLNGVYFTSPTEGWVVGGDVTAGKGVLLHYSWGTWTSVTPPIPSSVSSTWWLSGVHFTSASNGWAVGYDGTNHEGVLLHYSWGTWTSVAPPNVSKLWSLFGVYFTSPSSGWAVGWDGTTAKGVLLHYSKNKWTSLTPPDPPSGTSNWDLQGVHFTSPTEGWAVGGGLGGVLFHYSGGTWTSVTPPNVSSNWWLSGVHFTSASDGWAVGYDAKNLNGVLFHYSGGTWTSVAPTSFSLSGLTLNGVHFTSPTEGWAVGYDYWTKKGLLLDYVISDWGEGDSPSVSNGWGLNGVHCSLWNEGWAVGYDWANGKGVLLHYSYWPISFNSKLNIKGFAQDSNVNDGWCHIYPDETFLLHEDAHGAPRSYTGTYIITPDGKSISFTLDSNGLSEMQGMLTDWVTEIITNTGKTIQNISFVFDSVSISKGTIQKKTNAPSMVTIKISGTVSALVDGSPKTASFTYQSTLKYYSS